jgi:hypothetical protein
LTKKQSSGEVRLLPPRRVPLTAQQHAQAVELLAELLLDAAVKRREIRSGGALDGALDSVSGSVVPFPEKREKGRDAA